MDSMRSLNRSLPSDTKPPEAILQAFKNAALSVTKLYREAATSQFQSRQAGYQDALDDLLAFLDKENLGLGDGEGWTVRQWATERLDGSAAAGPADGSEDEDEKEADQRGESPVSNTHDAKNNVADSSPPPTSTREQTSPPRTEESTLPARLQSLPVPKLDAFSFSADLAYPRDVEMSAQDSSSPPADLHLQAQPQAQPQTQPQSIRLRPSRTRHNPSTAPHRPHTRATRPLGQGGGTKRKIALCDFFDLGNLAEGKDGFGGGGGGGREAGGGGGGGGGGREAGGGKRGRTT